MSIQIYTVSRTDQDPVEPRPRRSRVIWRPNSANLQTPPKPEDFTEELGAFLSSPKAHLLQKPRLPEDKILKAWKKMWIDVPDWIELHFISCEKMDRGDPIPSIPFSLPAVVRRPTFKNMGFGDVSLRSKGLNLDHLDRALRTHFSDHGPSGTDCWHWTSMIYLLFHVKTGKIYIGSYSRDDEIGWLLRLREHFNNATTKIGKGENKKHSSPELYWTMRTSTLSDWKVFALKQISLGEQEIRFELEGWWINKLGGLKSNHGFNGGVPSIIANDPLVCEHPVLEKMYIRKVQNALEIHRDILKEYTAPNPHIDAAAQDVCVALRLLHCKMYELAEWLDPVP